MVRDLRFCIALSNDAKAVLYRARKLYWNTDEKTSSNARHGRPIDLEKHVLCVNGAVFEKRLSPTLRMLEDVYADRKKAKKVMMDKKEEYKAIQDEIARLEAEI